MRNVAQPQVVMRVPGPWGNLEHFASSRPSPFHLADGLLQHPVGPPLWFQFAPADGAFPHVFRTGLKQAAEEAELAAVDGYRHNAVLVGYGGGLDCGRWLLQAALAAVQAGGAGVFVDNSGASHGAAMWRTLAAEAGDAEAVMHAFVQYIGIRKRQCYESMGMHVLGHRDSLVADEAMDETGFRVFGEFLMQTLCGGREWSDGDLYRCPHTDRKFRINSHDKPLPYPGIHPDNPMLNPYGHWRLDRA